MTIREAKRVLFLRMSQDPVSAQEKAGLEFAYGIIDMIDEKKLDVRVLSDVRGDNGKSKKAETKKPVEENNSSAKKAAGDEKIRKRTPIERTCQECGKTFKGGGTAKYCDNCKRKVKLRQTKEYNKRRRTQKALDELEDTRLIAEQLAAM